MISKNLMEHKRKGNKMNKPKFSLYLLPMISAVSFAITMLIVQFFVGEESLQIADIPSMMIFLGILVFILMMAAITGFMMSIYYHFKILRITLKNIIFAIAIAAIVSLLYGFGLWGVVLFLEYFSGELGILMGFSLIMLAPFIFPLTAFYGVKFSHRKLDQYFAEIPIKPSFYWRFANSLTVYAFYGVMILTISILLPSIGALYGGYFFVTNISTMFAATMIPVGLFLLINALLPSKEFNRLYLKKSWMVAFVLVMVTTVLVFIVGLMILNIIFGKMTGILFLGSVGVCSIVLLIAIRITMNSIFKSLETKTASNYS